MKKPSRSHWRYAIIAISLVVFIIFAVAVLVKRAEPAIKPDNLGPNLEYIGKRDLGCFLFWCEVEPYSVYYFATDMKQDDLKKYFPHAFFLKEPEGGGSFSPNYTSRGFEFTVSTRGESFLIQYYTNTAYLLQAFHLKQTNKAHVISITDSGYPLAQSAL